MKTLILFFLISLTTRANTIELIKERGFLNCGVSEGLTGFSTPNAKGEWSGFDVDICKAVAVSLFNDTSKVKYLPTSLKNRFSHLEEGKIDLLSRNTSRTFSREVTNNIEFAPVIYFDVQGVLVEKKGGVSRIADLDNQKICVKNNTTSQENIIDYFKLHKLRLREVRFDNNDQLFLAFQKRRCVAVTSDITTLTSESQKFHSPNSYRLLKERVEKEPLAPAIVAGDKLWKNLVTWTIYSLIWAEELGINSTNIELMKKNRDPRVIRFFGKSFNFEKVLGVSSGWTGEVISKVGNYHEIFHRNLGENSSLKIKRGLNELWSKGGLLYSPPMK